MSEPFSFRSIVPPGAGARAALEQTLALWKKRELVTKRPHWVYAGPADMLLRHGQFFVGRDLPERWDHVRGEATHCHHNSLAAAEAEPELRFFTGLYTVGREPSPHSWCVDADGLVCELTFPDQRCVDASLAAGHALGSLVGDNGGQSGIPWLPPITWAYVGVEFTAEFVREHNRIRGLPLLDPLCERTTPFGDGVYEADEELPMWATPYSKDGWPITSPRP